MSERVRVTLLSVEIGKQEKTGSEGAVQGDGGRYYYLPGASYDETVGCAESRRIPVERSILGRRAWCVEHESSA